MGQAGRGVGQQAEGWGKQQRGGASRQRTIHLDSRKEYTSSGKRRAHTHTWEPLVDK